MKVMMIQSRAHIVYLDHLCNFEDYLIRLSVTLLLPWCVQKGSTKEFAHLVKRK